MRFFGNFLSNLKKNENTLSSLYLLSFSSLPSTSLWPQAIATATIFSFDSDERQREKWIFLSFFKKSDHKFTKKSQLLSEQGPIAKLNSSFESFVWKKIFNHSFKFKCKCAKSEGIYRLDWMDCMTTTHVGPRQINHS